MFASLDLNWKPSATSTAPPAGKAPAIVRGDTYVHTFRITDGWADLNGETFTAQIRASRLTGATAAAPLAEFAVDLDQDGADLLVIVQLDAEVTVALPTDGFWDLQTGVDDPISTILAGKVKVLDDVTRAAS